MSTLRKISPTDLSQILVSHKLWWDSCGDTSLRADLSQADLVGLDMSAATLCVADFHGADLTGANLTGADLRRADFRGANLTGANLSGADLTDANLSGANLSGAIGLPAAPVIDHIDARILAACANGDYLHMQLWHRCPNSIHCRGGWAIHLAAGRAGYRLEGELGSEAAAALIYAASRPGQAVPNFYVTAEWALRDLRACAALDPVAV